MPMVRIPAGAGTPPPKCDRCGRLFESRPYYSRVIFWCGGCGRGKDDECPRCGSPLIIPAVDDDGSIFECRFCHSVFFGDEID